MQFGAAIPFTFNVYLDYADRRNFPARHLLDPWRRNTNPPIRITIIEPGKLAISGGFMNVNILVPNTIRYYLRVRPGWYWHFASMMILSLATGELGRHTLHVSALR